MSVLTLSVRSSPTVEIVVNSSVHTNHSEYFTDDQSVLPAKFVGAAEKLFEQGLPDPRGGEYHEAEIKTSGVWGNTQNIKIHCWLMKQKNSEGENLCVGWNGLVYPVIAVGAKADLRADVLEMIRKDEEARKTYQADRSNFPFNRFDIATPNGISAQPQELLPMKAVLLWRLGQKQLAGKVWNAWKVGTDFSENSNYYIDDPYLKLSVDWSWALFDRAVTEEMQGNNKTAVRDARLLASIQDKIEAVAAARGFKLRETFNNEKPRYLSFLAPLPILLQELERRNASLDKKTPSLSEITAISNSDEKIRQLINKLEDVSARQEGQPGGVSLGSDEIVKMLIAQGNSAVEPLLQTIEFDDRLTRSVSFHRNFFRSRHLITVAQAAYEAITQILKTNAFISGDTIHQSNLEPADGRKKVVSEIRAYLNKYGSEKPEERWYNILLDDNAPVEQWRLAAANIIYSYPADDVPSDWVFYATPAQSPDSKALILFRGLPLRSKTAPSVSQLFADRVSILSKREDTNSFYTNLSAATNIAMALLIWDSRAGIPVAGSLQKVIEQKFNPANRKLDSNHIATLRSLNIALYLKRAQAGDFDALKEYAD